MLHVMVSVKSRRVPGAMTDEELFSNEQGEIENGVDHDEYDDVLTPEEKRQLNSALKMGNSENVCDDEEPTHHENSDSVSFENSESNAKDKKNDSNGESMKGRDKSVKKKKKKGSTTDLKHESEYKKGLRPVLWLTPDFPLKTNELVPLLDILANKVKAIRRLRELLTTKLPTGTFPVKFEELQSASEEFSTPLSSPTHFQDSKSKEGEGSTSWISWMKGTRGDNTPADYTWVDANEKKRRMKAKKGKTRKHKKKSAADRSGENGSRQMSKDLE
ncbi:hypothetical protein SSX86_010740 [Deinandra increscens subsp. villosa]|uniref:Ankyrin repeat domain-containing protein n=1 Tax=Deinandra increscens subsp. villosa TaxID=3103831 RepID=A0AAP0D8I6_9ASTR